MKESIRLSGLLAKVEGDAIRVPEIFAILALGIVESLANGALSSADAIKVFFNAENCLFVRKKLRDETADEIMSRGVQLEDLFETLPEQEAQQEFQRELSAIRSLCLELIGQHRAVA
jgi:hypothetical protein